MKAPVTPAIAVGRPRSARTGGARLSVRRVPLCAMGFGETHGALGILQSDKWLIGGALPGVPSRNFRKGRACRAFGGVPCAPSNCGARGAVRCRALPPCGRAHSPPPDAPRLCRTVAMAAVLGRSALPARRRQLQDTNGNWKFNLWKRNATALTRTQRLCPPTVTRPTTNRQWRI